MDEAAQITKTLHQLNELLAERHSAKRIEVVGDDHLSALLKAVAELAELEQQKALSAAPKPSNASSQPLIEPDPRQRKLLTRAWVLAEKHRLDHLQRARDYTLDTFEEQNTASNIILCLVILIVLVGIGLSIYQFKIGAIGDAGTELEFSTASVKLKSSILGVVILALSLGFFSLYLTHVYKIEIVGASNAANGAE